MAISKDLTRMIKATRERWNKEDAIHFCRLAKKGATFQNVVYPTGLRTVIAEFGSEKAEVALRVAKHLRNDGYIIFA